MFRRNNRLIACEVFSEVAVSAASDDCSGCANWYDCDDPDLRSVALQFCRELFNSDVRLSLC